MSSLFHDVKPGDTVHYSTPQGQSGKGKVVLRYDTHVVVNRGKGQPQVVNDKNYIKHERGGKVVGALLSRLSQVKEDKANMEKHAKWMKDFNDKDYKARSGEAWERVHAIKPGILTRLSARARGIKLNKQGKVQEMRNPAGPYGGHPYDWDPELRKAIFAGMAKKVKQNGPKDNGRPYVPTKSGPPPRRGTTSEAAKLRVPHVTEVPSQEKPVKKSPEHQGLIPSGIHNRHAEPLKQHSDSEGARHGGWSGMEDSHDAEGHAARIEKSKKKKKLHELNTGTLSSYVSKAIADRKKQQGMADQARRIHTPERSAYFVDKANKKADKRSAGIKTAVGKIAKAYEETEVTEARDDLGRSEYNANMAMSGGNKQAKGHYLMKDGRKLSGPHSPEDAVKKYKGMSDSKGVKIVHVKEGVEIDVTNFLMEADSKTDKYKKAAQKAISLAKKAKGNKHVDTEPKLELQDKGGNGPIESNHKEENDGKL